MESSKHVETCLVGANDDFDEIFTWKIIFGQKFPKTDTVEHYYNAVRRLDISATPRRACLVQCSVVDAFAGLPLLQVAWL